MAASNASLDGKIALITGAASGIGRATALRFAAEGAEVVVADIDEKQGREVANKAGGRFERLDVSSPVDWTRVVEGLRARGGLDVAFLNAGVTTVPLTAEGFRPFDIAALEESAYRRILGVNVDGVVFGARAVVPALADRGGGAIVATASLAGLIGFAPDPIYTMTKHAVVGLVRALAPTLAARKITVNAICPGGVDTAILGPGGAERARQAGAELMDPAQIADAVVNAVTAGETGGLWMCMYGKPHTRYEYAQIEGLR